MLDDVLGTDTTTPESDVVQEGAEYLETLWETQEVPTKEELEKDEKSAEQLQKMLTFLERAWAASETLKEDDEDRETLRSLVTDTMGLLVTSLPPEYIENTELVYAYNDAVTEYKRKLEEEGDKGLFDQAVDKAKGGLSWALGGNPVGRQVSRALDILARPAEGIQSGVAMILADDKDRSPEAFAALGRGLTFQEQPDDFYGLKDQVDTDSDGSINAREILGVDADLGGDGWLGLTVGALDTVGLALTDPTSYVGIGLAGRAKAGIEAAERVGGRALAREVAENGLRNVDESIQAAIGDEVRRGVTRAFEQGRRMSPMERIRRMDRLQAAERQAREQIGAIATPTGRLSFAGQNIRSPIDALAEANPLRRQYGAIEEAGNVLDTASSGVRRNLAHIFGDGVENATRTANGVRVEGKILSDGKPVGAFERELLDDGTAIFNHSGVDEALQRSGIGTEFLEQQVQGLADEGFHTIKMTAQGDGVAVWGRRGFDYDVDAEDFSNSLTITSRAMRERADEIWGELTDVDALDLADEMTLTADTIDIAIRNGDPSLLPDLASDDWARVISEVDAARIPMIRKLDGVADEQGQVRQFVTNPEANIGQRFTADVTRRGVTDLVPERVRGALDGIRPRAAVARNLGQDAERITDDARVATQGVSDRLNDEMATEINAAATAAAKEFGAWSTNRSLRKGIKSADEYVRAALEGDDALARDVLRLTDDEMATIQPSEFAELAAKQADAEGMTAVANYIRTADRWRSRIDEASGAAGLADEAHRRFYVPRVLTREGRKAVIDNPALEEAVGPRSAATSIGEMGFHSERTFRPDAPVAEVNRALAAAHGLPEGTQIFTESVLGAFASRGRAAFRAATEADIFRGLQNEIVDGTPLALIDDGSKAVTAARTKAGYASLQTPAGKVWMPKEMVKEFQNVREAISSDEWVQGFTEFRRNWSQIWGANATSPLIDGIGFHSRNALGNLSLNALAGVINPVDYARALRLQRTIGRAAKAVKKGKSTWDSVWDDLKVKPDDRALITALRDHKIMGSGFFDDVVQGTADRGKVYEILGNNAMIRQGRALGSAVEDNARIAHYISKLDAPGGTPEAAARSVRKFLFDYSDLTEFERSLRHVSRFYTFMRKSTGVQLWALTHVPGRVANIERSLQSPLGSSEIGSALGLEQPGYSRERGDTIKDALGLGGTVSSFDTPFSAAVDTLTPLYEIANMLPGVQELVPGESSAQRLVESLYNLTAGGERSFIDAVYETLQKKDLFTGASLEDEGAEAQAQKWIESLIGPAWSQLDRFIGRATEGEGVGPLGNNMSEAQAEIGHELVVLSNILGMSVAPYGDAARSSNLYAINEYLEKALEGRPTTDQLRDTGLLGKKETGLRRLNSEITQEKIAEAKAAGLPTEALEAKLEEQLLQEKDSGTRVDEDGYVTSQQDRIQSYALGLGLVSESGAGKYDTLASVLYNEEHPDDPVLDEDGTPLDEYDVPVKWDMTSKPEIEEWAKANPEVPLTPAGNVGTETILAWNATHPDRPYIHSIEDRIKAGIRPIQGIYEVIVDGKKVGEWRPPGGGFYGPSVLTEK